MSGLAGAFWLAKKEMRRAWLSYPMTGLYVLFLGFFVVQSLSGVFEFQGFGARGEMMEDRYNAFFSDYFFLIVCSSLAVNVLSRDYALIWHDAFSSRLIFLRRLPISAQSLAGSRALCMLFALVLNAPAFFLPAFLLLDVGEPGALHLYFAGVWIGYSLLASGLWLILELSVSGRVYTLISFGLAASLMVVLALLEWAVDLSLVGRATELARSYWALPAVFSILAGAAAFAILSRLTVRRLQKRDLSA